MRMQWRAQGLELLVHVDGATGPQADGWAALKALAASSALTLTEEMPTSPYAQWTHVRTSTLPFEHPLLWRDMVLHCSRGICCRCPGMGSARRMHQLGPCWGTGTVCSCR
jgi:hypothetical protein